MTTTAFELPGRRIIINYGLVRGILVRSRSIFGNIGAAFQTLAGGNITLYTELCEKTRKDAYDLMILHAESLKLTFPIYLHHGRAYDEDPA